MGTGKNAAIESRMTTELFRKFISGGICGTAAIRMMNGLLLTKSPQETFATLDVARFDLDAGEMTMMKSGAATAERFPASVPPHSRWDWSRRAKPLCGT